MATKRWEQVYPEFDFITDYPAHSTPWAGHRAYGYNLVKNFPPDLLVELGSWKGVSFFSFCQAVKDVSGKGRLVAVDTWKGDEHAGLYGENVFIEFKTILKLYYTSIKAEYIRSTFDEALPQFEEGSIDILNIDGYHTYDAVSHDFNTYVSKVKKDGIIMFHDISVIGRGFGVLQFWAEIKAKYPYTLEFAHSHGLGVLFLDKEKYDIAAQEFADTKIKCLEYAYQSTKSELYVARRSVLEVQDIKKSKFWKLKETMKKMLFMRGSN